MQRRLTTFGLIWVSRVLTAGCFCFLIPTVASCARTVSVSDVPPGSGSAVKITGYTYDEIWAAALKVANEHFEVSEQDKSRGAITAFRGAQFALMPSGWYLYHWNFHPMIQDARFVGVYVTPPRAGADQYVIEVVTRDAGTWERWLMETPPALPTHWEERIPRNIREVLAGQPMS